MHQSGGEPIFEEGQSHYGATDNAPSPGGLALSDQVTGDTAHDGRDPLLNDNMSAAAYRVALRDKPHIPPQNPCLWCFHLLEGITVVSSLCLVISQILPLFMFSLGQIGVLNLALKVYISLFCIMCMANEVEVPILKRFGLLQTYPGRGFFYSFMGLICVEEAYSERVKDMVAHQLDTFHVGWAAIFMQITSWLMLAVGVLYMLLGLCCMKRVKDRMNENERNAWKTYRDSLKEWKKKYGE